ncbi:MAG: methyltransferase domain-containing protein [Candidatus Acidiferrales bacterium]
MLHQRTRDVYFTALRGVNKLNYWHWKLRAPRATTSLATHLHLGCGPKYLPGFINVDGNLFRKRDVWLDLRNGLPFASNSIASIYSSHVFEHFYAEELAALLRECHRVLAPGAFLRAVVPDMAAAARAYLSNDAAFFSDFPRAHRSLGGKLSNLLFCEGGHRQGLDFSYLEELLLDAGFSDVWDLSRDETRFYAPEVFATLKREESGVARYSVFIESRK